jgi:UDP-N-acetylglucosamine--N-acetylmuramyl-(pentapeptide) pyrophosphoryl-undecaprenol N-acetylglucosamine transferase
LERETASKHRLAYQKILSGKIRRYLTPLSFLNNILDLFLFFFGTLQATFLFLGERPSAVFSKGGYGSLPTVLAAALLRVPIIIHESDIMPGLANRIALRFARRVATAFPVDEYALNIRRKAFYGGLPLQEGFYQAKNKKAGEYILFFGGSQGASSLNGLVFNNLEKILKIAPVVHLTGKNDFEAAQNIKSNLPKELAAKYTFYDFREDMDILIGGSKLVVCRAGANSVFEPPINMSMSSLKS